MDDDRGITPVFLCLVIIFLTTIITLEEKMRHVDPEIDQMRAVINTFIGIGLIAYAIHYYELGGWPFIAYFIGLIGISCIYVQIRAKTGD